MNTCHIKRDSLREMRSNVAENQRVAILSSLVAANARISAARRSELIFSNIGDAGWKAKEKPLNGNVEPFRVVYQFERNKK